MHGKVKIKWVWLLWETCIFISVFLDVSWSILNGYKNLEGYLNDNTWPFSQHCYGRYLLPVNQGILSNIRVLKKACMCIGSGWDFRTSTVQWRSQKGRGFLLKEGRGEAGCFPNMTDLFEPSKLPESHQNKKET